MAFKKITVLLLYIICFVVICVYTNWQTSLSLFLLTCLQIYTLNHDFGKIMAKYQEDINKAMAIFADINKPDEERIIE